MRVYVCVYISCAQCKLREIYFQRNIENGKQLSNTNYFGQQQKQTYEKFEQEIKNKNLK